jgi:hypothetical protein
MLGYFACATCMLGFFALSAAHRLEGRINLYLWRVMK